MTITKKNLPKAQIELTIEVPLTEMQPYLEKAAKHIATEHTIPGFRPGTAPYDVIAQKFGEMSIYQEALEGIVSRSYAKAVVDEKLEVVGRPEIAIEKLAPGNALVYKAVAPLVPSITLAPYDKVKFEAHDITVTEKDTDDALKELSKMQRKEVLVDRPLEPHDKVVVDMLLSIDRVPVEGGQAKEHSIYMDEEYYIPGLKEQLIGVKAGEEKNFALPFPKEHYQKHLAGKLVDFKVNVKGVYALTAPGIDEAFAKSLGQESLEKLRALLKENITAERQMKERDRQDGELLDAMVGASKFGDIPELLVKSEIERMLAELEERVTQQTGQEFGEYLKAIKKTRENLLVEFAPQAVERIKRSLVLHATAKQEAISVSEDELSAEIAKTVAQYQGDPNMQESVQSDDAKDYVRGMLRNRKTLQLLKEKVGKQ